MGPPIEVLINIEVGKLEKLLKTMMKLILSTILASCLQLTTASQLINYQDFETNNVGWYYRDNVFGVSRMDAVRKFR